MSSVELCRYKHPFNACVDNCSSPSGRSRRCIISSHISDRCILVSCVELNWVVSQVSHEQEIRSVELACLSNATFHVWSGDVHQVQNLLLCTKFHENRMIFHRDMAIYRFSKWQPSAILELFYHHTRPPTKSVAGRSCLLNFMPIWYTDLKI